MVERVREHLNSVRKCMEEPNTKDMNNAGPLLKHHWTYHQGSQPNFLVKVVSKHYTAFSRQIREGVLITKTERTADIVINSKSEVLGTRIARKRVELNGQVVEMLEGDMDKLTGEERKLVAELEERGGGL